MGKSSDDALDVALALAATADRLREERAAKPSLGRIVLFREFGLNSPPPQHQLLVRGHATDEVFAAIIVFVNGHTVNLTVFNHDGSTTYRRDVPFDPDGRNHYSWHWPPRV